MKKLFVGCLLLLVSYNLSAQEQRVFSQFFMNPYIYNSAYAGVEGHSTLFMMHRAQYSGLTGGPSFSHATFHTPMAKGVGLGGMMFNELEGGILKTSGFKATASYLIAHDKKHYFRFGMSLGAGTTSLDDSDPAIAADIFGDPAFSNLSNKYLIADFGVSYHFDHFNIGLSVPNLIGREVISSESFSPIKVSPLDNILMKMNYRGHISHDFAIEPHILYRYSNITTSQYEAAMIMHLKHIVWVGGSYRQGAGINALVGFKVKEKFGIGYAFELGNSNISSITGTTHELHIGYHLSEHKKHHGHGHHQSFIKSHKLTAEERAALAEKKAKEREEKEKREQERLNKLNEPKETTEPTDQTTDDKTQEPSDERNDNQKDSTPADQRDTTPEDRRDTTPTDGRDTSTGDQSRESQQSDPSRESDNTSRNNQSERDNNNTNTTTRPQPGTPTPTNEKITSPEGAPRVKRGTHFLELPPGNHVIAGAFSEFERAENYSDQLFQKGFHDTIVGYQSEKGYYYVVLFRSADHATAAKQRTRIRKTPGLEDVWIMTIE